MARRSPASSSCSSFRPSALLVLGAAIGLAGHASSQFGGGGGGGQPAVITACLAPCIIQAAGVVSSSFGCAIGNLACGCPHTELSEAFASCANTVCPGTSASVAESLVSASCAEVLATATLSSTTRRSSTSTAVLTTTDSEGGTIIILGNPATATITQAATTGTGGPGSTNTATPSSSTSGDGGGISGGAIAGIVIGALVALAAFALAGWYFGRRKKDTTAKSEGSETPSSEGHGSPAALLARLRGGSGRSTRKAELEGTPVNELPTSEKHMAHEVPADEPIHELPEQTIHELPGSTPKN